MTNPTMRTAERRFLSADQRERSACEDRPAQRENAPHNARTLLQRCQANPILSPQYMPFECYSVFNAGAVRFDGAYLLLLRCEDFRRRTKFHVATSRDGIHFDVRPEPIVYPLRPIEQRWGASRFDMRITPLDGRFYLCHAVWMGRQGCAIAMAETTDFVTFRHAGSVSVPSNRNAALFPKTFAGQYARLERPQNIDGSGHIWISYSPDLVHWGNAVPLDYPIASWASRKSGAGAVPIQTDRGWLLIYHGTCMTASTENYYLGAMLLDLDDPSKVLGAPSRFLLAAELEYECVGQVPNVVFTAGAVEKDNGEIHIYYGGADTRMCLATGQIDRLVSFCLSSDSDGDCPG